MTDESGKKICDLLFLSRDAVQDNVHREMRRDAEVSQTRLAWSFIGSEATQAVDSVLDKDIFEVVAEGWAMADVLLPYADKKLHPQGERSLVRLLEHSFVKVLHPVLDIMWGDRKCVSLKFDLELAANFRTVALSICDGYIVAADSGDGNVSATLKYGDVKLHKKESPRVPFPGHRDFRAPGLAIRKERNPVGARSTQ